MQVKTQIRQIMNIKKLKFLKYVKRSPHNNFKTDRFIPENGMMKTKERVLAFKNGKMEQNM